MFSKIKFFCESHCPQQVLVFSVLLLETGDELSDSEFLDQSLNILVVHSDVFELNFGFLGDEVHLSFSFLHEIVIFAFSILPLLGV